MGVWQEIHWFAIHTKAHKEDVAASNIKRLSLDVLVPKICRKKRIRGELKAVAEPLFPGYLFARFCPAAYLHLIQYARGVRRVVSGGDLPIPVDEQIIEAIQSRTLAEGYVRMDEGTYRKGQQVQIQEGPLKEVVGLFDQSLDSRERVVILLENISYQARVITEKYRIKACS